MQIEKPGQSVGRDTEGIAGHGMGCHAGKVFQRMLAVIHARDAHIDAAITARQGRGAYASVFQTFPAHFQQQTLLRVLPGSLTRRDAEKAGIELVNIRKRAGSKGDTASGFCPVRVLQLVHWPAIGRDARDTVSPFRQQRPHASNITDITGKTEGHADNGNML